MNILQITKKLEENYIVNEIENVDMDCFESILDIQTKKKLFKKRAILVVSNTDSNKENCINNIEKLLDKEKIPRPSIIWLRVSQSSEDELFLFNDKYLTFLHTINVVGEKKEYDLDFYYDASKHVKTIIKSVVEVL